MIEILAQLMALLLGLGTLLATVVRLLRLYKHIVLRLTTYESRQIMLADYIRLVLNSLDDPESTLMIHVVKRMFDEDFSREFQRSDLH